MVLLCQLLRDSSLNSRVQSEEARDQSTVLKSSVSFFVTARDCVTILGRVVVVGSPHDPPRWRVPDHPSWDSDVSETVLVLVHPVQHFSSSVSSSLNHWVCAGVVSWLSHQWEACSKPEESSYFPRSQANVCLHVPP
jgi:hypothetical protein